MAFLGIARNTKFLAAAPVRNGRCSWKLGTSPITHGQWIGTDSKPLSRLHGCTQDAAVKAWKRPSSCRRQGCSKPLAEGISTTASSQPQNCHRNSSGKYLWTHLSDVNPETVNAKLHEHCFECCPIDNQSCWAYQCHNPWKPIATSPWRILADDMRLELTTWPPIFRWLHITMLTW